MHVIKKILVWILTIESRLIIGKYKPFIVAITGSVGKTSTKDAVYRVLESRERFVRKSEKSMNSEIGLPLTIIGAPNAWRNIIGWMENIFLGLKLILVRVDYPSCLILEIGADHPGDIRSVAKWLHPDVAIITKVGKTPVHVEFFKSPEQVFEEKALLVESVKNDGALVLFADDDKVSALGDRVRNRNVKVLTFGIEKPAMARGEDYQCDISSGISFALNLDGEKMPVRIQNVLGKVYLYSLLAAAAVGKVRNVPFASIVESLNKYEPPKGRMNIIAGVNGSTIIDDSYNSSPDAVNSALETLKSVGNSSSLPLNEQMISQISRRKIAVLGDMMELGKYSAEAHRQIGKEAAGIADILVTVGPRSRVMAEEALKCGMPADYVKSFDSSAEAAPYAVSLACAGDIILVKGSQSPRLERVTKALLREPEKADKLLVRQEREWLEKE
jgi:UDP-N-acetylmuramoyl-tripeptide--D-alanyl-D-alanine ligase